MVIRAIIIKPDNPTAGEVFGMSVDHYELWMKP